MSKVAPLLKKTLQLNISSFSVNSMYAAGNSRFGKSGEAKEWTYLAYSELNKWSKEIKDLKELFSEKEHGYGVELEWFFTRDKLITKKGILSSRAHDLSNVEKNIVDVLFLPSNAPFCENLNIDDRYLIELKSSKKVSPHSFPFLLLTVYILPLDFIESSDQQ